MLDVENTQAGSPCVLYRLGDLRDKLYEDAQLRHDTRTVGRPIGVTTGLSSVDRVIHYMEPGLHVLHGGPGSGKTAFALQIACECGFPALYVSCEMLPIELLRRIIARKTQTELRALKNGERTPEEVLSLMEAALRDMTHDFGILDATREYIPAFGANGPDICTLAQAVKGDSEHALIVVDSVHAWAHRYLCTQPFANEYDCLNTHIEQLTSLALHLQCPVLAISERNRASMDKGGLNAAAGTRRFEFAAETVIDLDRKDEGDSGRYDITLSVCKNRNGQVKPGINLRFDARYQRFEE